MNLVKSNIVLGIAAIVLAVPTWLTLRGDVELFTDLSQVPKLFGGFTADNVAGILLGEPKAEQPAPPPNQDPNQKRPIDRNLLQFVRGDKGWTLGPNSGDLSGAPVLRDRIDSDVFKHLAEIRNDKQVTVQSEATEAQLEQYGLDELHAFVIKAVDAQNGTIAELFVGREASPGQFGSEAVRGVFVRRTDSTDVILYEVPYWRRDVKPDQWLDRTVLKLEPTKVQRLTLKSATYGEFTFAKKPGSDATWEATPAPDDLGAVRQTEVEGLVQRLRWVQAADLRMPLQRANRKPLGLEPAQIEVQVTTRDGDVEKTVVLGIGTKVDGKNEVYASSTEHAFLLTLPAHIASPLERSPREYCFDPKGPPPNESKPGDAPQDGGKKPEEPKKG